MNLQIEGFPSGVAEGEEGGAGSCEAADVDYLICLDMYIWGREMPFCKAIHSLQGHEMHGILSM